MSLPIESARPRRRTSISAKLAAIVAVFVVVISAVIGLFLLGHNVSSGVRGYVTGEGLWSKAQKDAVYALSRYLNTQDERDYRDYLAALQRPLGDRSARLEMEKPNPDHDKVTAGFVQGGIAAEDVPQMIFLFRWFRTQPYFSQAIVVWREAEAELMRLPPLADAAHARIRAGSLSRKEQTQWLARIEHINTRVTPLEQQFSEQLAAGAREVQALLLRITLATAAALIAIGVLFAWSISRNLRLGISRLRDGAMRVSQGDLSHPIPVQSGDELGELVRVFNSMIASRHEAEAALRTANEFREKVMESATNAIYTMDLEGRFTTANKRTCEVTGYELRELIGRTWGSMVREQDLPALFTGFVSTIEGREPVNNRETSLKKKDGTWVVIVFSIAPLRRDGVIFGVVGAAEDITVRKRAEAELNARAEELVRSNRELEQFAYVASHDLQEPLRTVTGFAQLLQRRYRGKLDDEADEFIGYISAGVTRMKSLIEDLLAFARVRREEHAVSVVALDTLLSSAIANLGGAIRAAGAQITHSALPALAVDTRQITQLFQNLIGNAIKFRSTEPPTVRITAELQETEWRFSVVDNGIGIQADAVERIFVLFQRMHTRDHYEGNGIGLTICKKIVELHGGRIWVESAREGGGTIFRFTLPAA